MDNVQQKALLANINENLHDDVAKLVYADFMEESGEEEYATYIHCSATAGHRTSSKSTPGVVTGSVCAETFYIRGET